MIQTYSVDIRTMIPKVIRQGDLIQVSLVGTTTTMPKDIKLVTLILACLEGTTIMIPKVIRQDTAIPACLVGTTTMILRERKPAPVIRNCSGVIQITVPMAVILLLAFMVLMIRQKYGSSVDSVITIWHGTIGADGLFIAITKSVQLW